MNIWNINFKQTYMIAIIFTYLEKKVDLSISYKDFESTVCIQFLKRNKKWSESISITKWPKKRGW